VLDGVSSGIHIVVLSKNACIGGILSRFSMPGMFA
jgi:hypothetical protein